MAMAYFFFIWSYKLWEDDQVSFTNLHACAESGKRRRFPHLYSKRSSTDICVESTIKLEGMKLRSATNRITPSVERNNDDLKSCATWDRSKLALKVSGALKNPLSRVIFKPELSRLSCPFPAAS